MEIVTIVVIIAAILLSATLHEAMHAFASYWLGDDTAKLQGRLTLNPIAHLDLFGSVLLPTFLVIARLGGAPVPIFGAAKPVPFNPSRLKYDEFGSALVALAGPLTNLGLAIISGLTIRFAGGSMSESVQDIFALFMHINLGFFVFNMIPFPPLDGSRVLYAVAPEALQNVMRSIERYGLLSVMIFLVVLGTPVLNFVFNTVTKLSELISGVSF